MIRLELQISGMLSVHAKHAVFSALSGVEGLSAVEIELGRVTLNAARQEADVAALEVELRAAIEAAGFAVSGIKRLPRQLPTI
jgi:copper chaperone CopZ